MRRRSLVELPPDPQHWRYAQPSASAFANDDARAEWRHVVDEGGGYWPRLFVSRQALELAAATAPHLESDLFPSTEGLLATVFSTSVESVLIATVEMLGRKRGVVNFEALLARLNTLSRPESARAEWNDYLVSVLEAARHTQLYQRAKTFRDEVVAHLNLTPKRDSIWLAEVRAIQSLAERVFVCFPEGESWHAEPLVTRDFPQLVQRIIDGDNRPDL